MCLHFIALYISYSVWGCYVKTIYRINLSCQPEYIRFIDTRHKWFLSHFVIFYSNAFSTKTVLVENNKKNKKRFSVRLFLTISICVNYYNLQLFRQLKHTIYMSTLHTIQIVIFYILMAFINEILWHRNE